MRLKKLIRLGALATCLLLLSSCASRQIVLYPIQQTDFYVQENGDICMTEFYFNEVLQVKIKEKK